MTRPACVDCAFYRAKEGTDGEYGECRRYAPQPRVVNEDDAVSQATVWPAVFGRDGCGEHSRTEVRRQSAAAEPPQEADEQQEPHEAGEHFQDAEEDA